MFKKRVFSLLIVTLLALLLALTLTGCRKGESSESVDTTEDVVVKEEKEVKLLNESRWVTADAGLRMRDSAGASGNKIGLIPYGEQVTLLLEEGAEESIAGASGRWSKVRWQKQEGWVFGGFLSTEQPAVVEESVGSDENADPVESTGKTVLIDGQEFDESVLYGLYLIDIKAFGYQIFELLPNRILKSHILIEEYDKELYHEFFLGFFDDYIDMLKKSSNPKSIMQELSVGEWFYDNKSSKLSILYFIENDNNFDKYKLELKAAFGEGKIEFTFIESEYEKFNYFDTWEFRILKIKG